MKKLIAILAMLAMGTGAMAADVTFSTVDNADGTATVSWTGTGVLGMGLEVSNIVGGALTGVTVNDFNVFIDEAFTEVNGGGTLAALPASNPVANADAAGAITDLTGSFALCAGYLEANNAGLDAGTIVFAADEDTTLELGLNAKRGGVVDMNGVANVVTVMPMLVAITVTPTEAVKNTASFYNDWVAWGKPSCWAFQRHCRGDANGMITGPFHVQTADLSILKSAYNKADAAMPEGGICADFNHAKTGPFRVQTADLAILKAYYNKAAALVPVCDMTDYNFWTN